MNLTPESELARRISNLQQHLIARELDGALLHGITNLFYFTGTGQQAHLWVPVSGSPVLLVRRVLERARRESALAQVLPLTSLRQLPDFVGQARRIGMELDILSVTAFEHYQKVLPNTVLVDASLILRLIRSIKSPYEIDVLRRGAEGADLTVQAIRAALREGVTELDLTAIGESVQRSSGMQGTLRWHATSSFEAPRISVLAGESALAASFADAPFGGFGLTPAVPYGASRKAIRRGEPVCVDLLMAVDGYVQDQTRTLAIGPLDRELTRAYEVAQAIHEMFRVEARPGVTGEEIWNKSIQMAAAAGLEEHFMGWGESRVRFLGHGVGLEIDELPVLAPRQHQALAVGSVIAVEPKFFFPGKGAVGLESTYALTAAGVERITLTGEEIAVVP